MLFSFGEYSIINSKPPAVFRGRLFCFKGCLMGNPFFVVCEFWHFCSIACIPLFLFFDGWFLNRIGIFRNGFLFRNPFLGIMSN